MSVRIGDDAPDFTAATTEGEINFYEYLGDDWGVLFSHPKDFTPVCTTELGAVAKLKPEFDKRGVKVIGLSVDASDSHEKWAADIEETQGAKVNFPLIADADKTVANLYDMIHPNASDTATVRSVFVIGADKKIKLSLTYPASAGRNFDEILRVIDSLQLTAKHGVATPANWKNGEDVIISPAISDEQAKEKVSRRLDGNQTVSARRQTAAVKRECRFQPRRTLKIRLRFGARYLKESAANYANRTRFNLSNKKEHRAILRRCSFFDGRMAKTSRLRFLLKSAERFSRDSPSDKFTAFTCFPAIYPASAGRVRGGSRSSTRRVWQDCRAVCCG